MPCFFDLPRELRDEIYSLAFASGVNDYWIKLTRTACLVAPANRSARRVLTQVNRQCREETSGIYLTIFRFLLVDTHDQVTRWLETIGANSHTRPLATQMQDLLGCQLTLPSREGRRWLPAYEATCMQRRSTGQYFGVYVRKERENSRTVSQPTSNISWLFAFRDAQTLERLRDHIWPPQSFQWPSHVDARDYSRPDGTAVPTLADIEWWGTPEQIRYARGGLSH